MSNIPLPEQVKVESIGPNRATVTVEPCYPGYGVTIGNALRRVLLSSLQGAAITAVKFNDVPHEFSSLPHVKEDVIDLILNLKQVRLRCFSEEPVTVVVKAKGKRELRAGDLATSAEVEVTNPDLVVATLTDPKAELNMELTVQRGRGYLPVESREKEKLELGTIAVDAIFSPVVSVGMKVDNVRVEQFTNYERVSLTVATDGSLSPEAAVAEAAKVLVGQFSFVAGSEVLATVEEPAEAKPAKAKATRKKKEQAEE